MPPRNQRGWWREEFYDHPGLASKRPEARISPQSDKFKIFCKRCFEWAIAETIVSDQQEVAARSRDAVRTRETIFGQCKFCSITASGSNFADEHLDPYSMGTIDQRVSSLGLIES